MSDYQRVTKYLPILESAPAEQVGDLLYGEFMHACYEPDMIDHEYLETLEGCGITDDMLWHANVESLDLKATVALLTFVLRADHWCEGSLMSSLKDGYLLRVLRRLAELDGTWERPNVVTFYHEYEKDGYLSNWYDSGFRYRGNAFPTSEHWMMWQKAMVFRDWSTAARILEATSPGNAKKLGKQVKPYSSATWGEARVPLMKVGLRQKFVQNARLMNDLLSTGTAALAEAAPNDRIWGLGIGKGDPRLDDPLEWHGKNLLGITLMKVRSDLRALSAIDGRLEWPIERLKDSHVWRMNLLELTRVPSTRPAALMYAAIVAQQGAGVFNGVKGVLRKANRPIGEIGVSRGLNMIAGLPIDGWYELLDELALQVRLGRI